MSTHTEINREHQRARRQQNRAKNLRRTARRRRTRGEHITAIAAVHAAAVRAQERDTQEITNLLAPLWASFGSPGPVHPADREWIDSPEVCDDCQERNMDTHACPNNKGFCVDCCYCGGHE